MKKYLIFAATIMAVCNVNAQLKVNSTGKVGMGHNPNVSYQLYVSSSKDGIMGISTESSTDSSAVGVTGKAYIPYHGHSIGVKGISSYNGFIDGKSFGVFGNASSSHSGENYGVFGHIDPHVEGAGVYGSSYFGPDYGQMLSARYAGYFYGDVKVTSNLTVDGALLYSSDHLYSVDPEENNSTRSGYAGQLKKLSANRYGYHPNLMSATSSKDGSIREEAEAYSVVEKQAMNKLHYGLDADLLEEVFPDVVYENEDGVKCINYVEMVPILVQTINELSAKIEALEGGNGDVMMAKNVAAGVDATAANVQILSLGQNKPNPFSTTTSVEVSVPEDVQSAFIYVYDLTGKKVQQADITARGKQTVQLKAASLEEGMYLYSLIADGKMVETRRMIIEK